MNKTEEWLYKKAREVNSEIELQDLYTSKFMFSGAWVMELIEEYHKEQLILSGVSQPSKYDFFCSNNLGQNWDFSEWKTLHEWDGTEYLYVG